MLALVIFFFVVHPYSLFWKTLNMHRISETLNTTKINFKILFKYIVKKIFLRPPESFLNEVTLNIKEWGQLLIWK